MEEDKVKGHKEKATESSGDSLYEVGSGVGKQKVSRDKSPFGDDVSAEGVGSAGTGTGK